MNCPACKSHNTFFDGVDNICIDCKKRWLRTDESRDVLLKTNQKVISCETKEVNIMAKYTECRNCERTMTIIGDGLCGGCYNAVYKKFEKGTAEYDAALAKIKAKVTDPNYKSRSAAAQLQKVEEKEPARKPRRVMTAAETQAKIDALADEHESQKPKKQQSDVVQNLRDRRHDLMEEMNRITEAINTIEKYQAA